MSGFIEPYSPNSESDILRKENADLRSQLAAATKWIEEAEKCEPVKDCVVSSNYCRCKNESLYTRPVPPADVAALQAEISGLRLSNELLANCSKSDTKEVVELQKRIAELERRLAEQQLVIYNYSLDTSFASEELNTLLAQLAAATQRIEEAEKCEPVGMVSSKSDQNYRIAFVDAQLPVKTRLYTRPVPPVDVAELQKRIKYLELDKQSLNDTAIQYLGERTEAYQRIAAQQRTITALNSIIGGEGSTTTENVTRIAELERKLSEQQAKLDTVRSLFIGGENLSPRERAAFDALRGDTYRELNTLLAQARKDAVPVLASVTKNYVQCSKHMGFPYQLAVCYASTATAISVCPNCEQELSAPSPQSLKKEGQS